MKWCIDEADIFKGILFVRGWCFSDKQEKIRIDIKTPYKIFENVEYFTVDSRDVVQAYGMKANNARFELMYNLQDIKCDIDKEIILEFNIGNIKKIACELSKKLKVNDNSRNAKIFSHINTKGYGIEIGPSHRPVAPKKAGFNVQIIDHLDREGLIEKYKTHEGINVNNIEEVDFIWNGDSYAQLTGKTNYYDYIIACHMIEHTTDLIGFLQECEEILNEEGALSLVIPDKRYCFDYFRPTTSLSAVIDNHLVKNKIHSPGTVAEHLLNAVTKNGVIAWTKERKGNIELHHTLKDAISAMNNVIDHQTFLDVHQWVFTPNSFRLLIFDLQQLGFINFSEACFYETNGHEFYITLEKGESYNSEMTRIDLLKLSQSDLVGF